MSEVRHNPPISSTSTDAFIDASIANRQEHFDKICKNFRFSECKDHAALDKGAMVRIADVEDAEDILRIQRNSAAECALYLGDNLVKELVANRQVLVSEIATDSGITPAGAIFFHCSDNPTCYRAVSNPACHDLRASTLYDFWVLTDKNHNRAQDKTSVAKSLIAASKELAAVLHIPHVTAFSRAGDAIAQADYFGDPFHSELFGQQIEADPDYKMAILLNYYLTVHKRPEGKRINIPSAKPDLPDEWPGGFGEASLGRLKEIKLGWITGRHTYSQFRKSASDNLFFEWLVDHHPGQIRNAHLVAIRKPVFKRGSGLSYAADTLVPVLGLLFRKHINETKNTPIDLTLGALHTGLGANMRRIHLDSRPGDIRGLGANVEMSYDDIEDLDEALRRAFAAYHADYPTR